MQGTGQVPPPIETYLSQMASQSRSLAYCKVTLKGHLLSWGGALTAHGLQALKKGSSICDYMGYLEGFFPLKETSEILPCIQTEQGLTVDIHLFISDTNTPLSTLTEGWIVLLDTTAETKQQQRLQQKGNDLSLLRHQYAKLLNQCLKQPLPRAAITGQFSETAQEVSVLLLKICDLTNYSHHKTPSATLKKLNTYLSIITQVIVEEGGVINHILGETAVAFFGLLPAQQSAAQQAVDTAQRLIKKFHMLTTDETSSTIELGIGVGITTGEAATGVVNSQGHQTVTAVGNHIQRAMQLSSFITPESIVLDLNTFLTSGHFQHQFRMQTLSSNGFEASTLYKLILE